MYITIKYVISLLGTVIVYSFQPIISKQIGNAIKAEKVMPV